MEDMISFFTMMKNNRVRSGAIETRAYQIADYLHARLDPKTNYRNGVCIYVKCIPPEDFPRKSFMDIVDATEHILWVAYHKKMGVIASSVLGKEYLSEFLNRRDVKYIPHHHCNIERARRTRTGVTVVGAAGIRTSLNCDIEKLRERLKEIGVELLVDFKPMDRKRAVDFYKKIDIQVLFRNCLTKRDKYSLKSPLKITNAGSFCIPTVSYPEPNYIREYTGYYIPVVTISELVNEVKKLKESPDYYAEWAEKGYDKAETYHISHTSELYKHL
jgi:hypothetical protein